MEFTFDDREVRALLRKVLDKTRAVKGTTDKYIALLSAIVFRDIMEHFDKEQGPDGAWKPWSKSYTEHMKEIGRSGNKKLQFSGRMRQNFTPQKYRKATSGVVWFNNAKVKGGFPYAHHHNLSREFMWASDKAIEEMAYRTVDFVAEEL